MTSETVKSMFATISYTFKNGLYINMTSRCPSACRFCIKFSWGYKFHGYDLKLPNDPPVQEILASIPLDLSTFNEVVYCGYGESTYRLSDLPELSADFRRRGAKRIRLNTVGLGNSIHKRDITPDLSRVVDAVCISLNTMDPKQYEEVVRPLPEFKVEALESVKEFCRLCVRNIKDVSISTVDISELDTGKVEAFANSIGAKFLLRPFLDEYEEI